MSWLQQALQGCSAGAPYEAVSGLHWGNLTCHDAALAHTATLIKLLAHLPHCRRAPEPVNEERLCPDLVGRASSSSPRPTILLLRMCDQMLSRHSTMRVKPPAGVCGAGHWAAVRPFAGNKGARHRCSSLGYERKTSDADQFQAFRDLSWLIHATHNPWRWSPGSVGIWCSRRPIIRACTASLA